jgi:hypothetical protein
MCKEGPLKLYKIEFALELVKWLLNFWLVKLMFFPEIYIKKEQIAWCKNDQATRKYPGHNTWVKALGLIMCKDDLLKLYKIKFATELIKCFLN